MQNLPLYSNCDEPGRFIFRIDEWIQPAGCLNTEFGEEISEESKFKIKTISKIQPINFRCEWFFG